MADREDWTQGMVPGRELVASLLVRKTPLQPSCYEGEGACRLIALDAASDRLKGLEGVHCWSKVVLTSFHCVRSVATGRFEVEQGVDFVYFIMIFCVPELPGTC